MNKLLLALFLLASSLVSAEELTGWEKIIQHEEGEVKLTSLPTISVEVNTEKVLVTIDNQTDTDLTYSGYGKTSPQLFIKRKENDEWVPSGWDWCGTGMERYNLKKGKKVVFELRKTHEPTQVFTIFTDENNRKAFSLIELYKQEG